MGIAFTGKFRFAPHTCREASRLYRRLERPESQSYTGIVRRLRGFSPTSLVLRVGPLVQSFQLGKPNFPFLSPARCYLNLKPSEKLELNSNLRRWATLPEWNVLRRPTYPYPAATQGSVWVHRPGTRAQLPGDPE